MSKESKFLSILTDMAQNGKNNKEDRFCLNSSELMELLLWLEQSAVYNGNCFETSLSKQGSGYLQLKAEDEKGAGTICQVRLFPLRTAKYRDTYFYLKNKELMMYLDMTGADGYFCKELPAGEYDLEISKGSEYEIIHQKLQIQGNIVKELRFRFRSSLSLKASGWYCGDLHHHSIYSSPVYGGTDPVVENPLTVARSMQAAGASFGALSDHHNILNHGEWRLTKTENFEPLISKEISTSNGHVMALGAEEDIIYEIQGEEDRTDEILRKEFIRITNNIKAAGGLPQINHPKDHSPSLRWNPAYLDIITIFETMEIWNGSNPMYAGTTNAAAFGLWRELLEEGRYLPATTGSDTHNILANDYSEYYAKMRWMESLIKNGRLIVPEGLKESTEYFLSLCRTELSVFEKWAKLNLGSAGVRTYVCLDGEINSPNILNSLRKGRSFLTNGPVLIPEIDGILPGGRVSLTKETETVRLTLMANRPLKRLYLYMSGNCKEEITLKDIPKLNGFYDYSTTLQAVSFQNKGWIFFLAEGDCTNMAITNPIFFDREEGYNG